MNLSEVANGKKGIILEFETGERLFNRLVSMGINRGNEFTVVRNSHHGPVVVDIDGSRFAVGRGMSEKILVKEI
jgi:Fe2+ transport system protein FeoA